MGLFDKRDKKRKDDFDSPVEQIDLGSVSSAPTPPPKPKVPEPNLPLTVPRESSGPMQAAAAPPATPAGRPAPAAPTAPAAQAPAPAPAPRPAQASPDTDDYGIERAIELMRTLPSDNIELVVQVVKFSLESVGIKLPAIIEDAIRRQKDIQGRIGVLRGEIADLEQEIKLRKDEIDRLEADHKETSMVRDRLELAENIGKPAKVISSPPTMDRPEPGASSQSLPRVTKQTSPPPMGSPSPMSPAAGPPIKK